MADKYLDYDGLLYFWTQLKNKLQGKADINSPNLTGTPTAPTAAEGNDSTQIATTAYVQKTIKEQVKIGTAKGKLIHLTDVEANTSAKSLVLLDKDGLSIASGTVAVTNKNIFRIDALPSSVTNKGVTFKKNADGSITATGTSTGTYAATTASIDKNAFQVGRTYAMSTGKTSGILYMQLALTYTDGTTDYLTANNAVSVVTIKKAVSAAVGSVQITASGKTVNETVWPQIEIAGAATPFKNNAYKTYLAPANMPLFTTSTVNMWPVSTEIESMELTYYQNTAEGIRAIEEKTTSLAVTKQNALTAGENITINEDGVISAASAGNIQITATDDGAGNVTIVGGNIESGDEVSY